MNRLQYGFWLLIVLLPTTCGAKTIDLDREIAHLYEGARAKHATLADWAQKQGLNVEAQKTKTWLRPRDNGRITLPILPSKLGTLQPKPDSSEASKTWQERFAALRRETAESLFLIAKQAVRQKHASLAFELVLLALEQDPDHEKARRVLGYQEYDGHWRNAYEIRKLRGGSVWDSRFGWILRSQLPRYEKGERYFKGNWISKEKDDRLHRASPTGWTIQTRHYKVSTNHSREMGAKLGEKLEEFHLVWKILFIRYYATEAQVASLFNERARPNQSTPHRHRIVFFQKKEDYVNALKPYFSQRIEGTLGVYVDRAQTAFFFLDEERSDDRTLYHEATHQLFHESRRVAGAVGIRANFWIVEGVALYMESLRREEQHYTLGGFEDQRMIAARYRLMNDGFYIPLRRLTATGMGELQANPNLPMIYSQMTGLTHFLIHGKNGRYRDALIEYLRAVYEGRHTPRTLQNLTTTPYPELDREYREFIEKGDPSAASR